MATDTVCHKGNADMSKTADNDTCHKVDSPTPNAVGVLEEAK